MMALCRSAAQGGQVALPLTEPADELALLSARLPEGKVLVSLAANLKEYG